MTSNTIRSRIPRWLQRKVPLSPLLLWLMLFYPLMRWATFWWAPGYFGIVFVGVMLVAIIPIAILSYTLLRRIRLHIPWVLALLAFVALIFLGQYAPHFARSYALGINDHFMQELNVGVELHDQIVQILTNDETSTRYVKTTYRLLAPRNVVEQKLKERLQLEAGWLLTEKEGQAIGFYCSERSSQVAFYDSSVSFTEERYLRVWISYPSTPECLLQ